MASNKAAAKPGMPSSHRPGDFAGAAKLLGGSKLLKREIASKLDVHEVIAARISKRALRYVVQNTLTLRQDDVADAVGMSVRTIQRLAERPAELLTKEQSSRVWKFAEVLAKASEVFGGREAGERWLMSPAMALEQHRPIELLTTGAGAELVEQLLGRLEYGVYT